VVDLFGLGADDQLLPSACKNLGRPARLNGHEILRMALMVSVPTIGLDQFLRISPANFPVQHWITDSLMTLPLFAAGCWAGDRVTCRTGSGTENRSEIVKRPIVISLFCALLLAPAWFAINKTDNPVTAQPLVSRTPATAATCTRCCPA
jgi:hypothetical protein